MVNYYGKVHNCGIVSGYNVQMGIFDLNWIGVWFSRKFRDYFSVAHPDYVPWTDQLIVAQRRDIDWHKSYLD